MARITSLELARMLEEDSDWNDSDEECHRGDRDDSDDDLVDNNGAEDCPLDFIERYEVFHCVSSCNRAGNSYFFSHVLYRLVPR